MGTVPSTFYLLYIFLNHQQIGDVGCWMSMSWDSQVYTPSRFKKVLLLCFGEFAFGGDLEAKYNSIWKLFGIVMLNQSTRVR